MLTTSMIGNKIAEARKRQSISQNQLAQRLFISPQAVGKWERGESMPDIVTLNRLAEVLGVDLNYFSEGFQIVSNDSAPIGQMNDKLTGEKTTEGESMKKKEKLSWDMSRGNWEGADFSGLKNLHDKFSSSNMQCCLFKGSDLSGLLLKNNNVENCDFTGSDFSKSKIRFSNLSTNIFKDCVLRETEFTGSNIYGCDFTGADFTDVTIKSGGFSGISGKKGSLEKNTIFNAIWNRTSFINSQIADLIFVGKLEDCAFENCTFTRVTFKNATIINTFFKNRSLKRINFVDCQTDRMTYEFLRNGKADMTGVTVLG